MIHNDGLSNSRQNKTHFRKLTHVDPNYSVKKKCKFELLVYPNSKFKIVWDLIVIALSVYNSVLIPYEFAYSSNTHIVLDVLDRVIDSIFIIDIVVNFRSVYKDSKTEELVTSAKKIAIKYVL